MASRRNTEMYRTYTPAPSFQTSRSPEHQHMGRHWSGQKQSPHRLRAGCGCCEVIPAGAIHYVCHEQGGQAVVCADAYRRATA